MASRSPIVVILGHVDHGKTSLLDYIRKSHLTGAEYGGITQKIGAYEIKTQIKGYNTDKITFVDTPGHEAFSKLRARGASVADIAILIIDAKDSIMPQTIESISHIKSSNIPFIVAINKVDLPDANIEKVKCDLLKHDVAVEDKGGKIPVVKISAKTGQAVEELLETILLLSSEMNLTYNSLSPIKAYIIETNKSKRGILISVIIKNGKIKVGDTIFNEDKKVKVRALINDLGKNINEAVASTPVEILGFKEIPQVGSLITSTAKASTKQKINEPTQKTIDPNSIFAPVIVEKKLSLIIKTNSQGSQEAVDNALSKNTNIKIILKAVGDINKSDVFLAKITKAIIIGFGVNIFPEVVDLAKQEKVIIKTYNIIYELLDELNEVASLMKEKEEKEKNLKGEAKILATFIIEGEKVFGVKIIKGKINLGDPIEVYRANNLLIKTKLVSLKIRAKSVSEAKKSQEAGMVFSPALDFKVGDVVKSIL